mmetsp:Transcript_49947/g.138730  ORF Transcript_49947/g.138730 Transcript_49947/m.138730 type:complete len:224 (+) Transcript_49947:593-1264(+)
MPVDAPLGTAARKSAVSVQRSTSTVGLPRESNISRALIVMIFGEAPEGASSKAATPGRTLPSNNSKEAPPPVLQCVTLSSVPYFLQAVAVSPPPMTVMVPAAVALTTASMRDRVPASNLAISKTPTGPFQMMVFADITACSLAAREAGPQSRPSKPSGMPSAMVAILISPPSPYSEEMTKSEGRMISTPSLPAFSMMSGTILAPSSSYKELPMGMPSLIFRKV